MELRCSAPHARYVRHGSLLVPRRFDRDYVAAKAYLSRDPAEAALFARLEGAPVRRYRLSVNGRNQDYFDPATDTIGWDPHSALRVAHRGRQSPALGLGHEIDHAVESRRLERKLAATPSRRYDDAEERRVIAGSERHAAKTLGEAVRYDHRGTCYRVRSPVAELLG
ncbi:MAG TPA: hypothetical protein VJP76_03420 [Candidatus Tumulicola sp.]|nr:hypothetical protein [Candidatus Tumulicola sp.]